MKSEIQLQSHCFQWAWNMHPQTRRCLFHVPNGGSRNKIEATQLKAAGVIPGIPDMLLLWNRRLYAFEFKTESGRLSTGQVEVHQAWALQGVTVKIIRDFDTFKAEIEGIINIEKC